MYAKQKHYVNLAAGPLERVSPLPADAFVSILPHAESRFLLIVAWEKQLRMWDHELHAWPNSLELKEERTPRPKVKANPTFAIPSTWAEPFVAFGKPPNVSFVTESGRVHAWRDAGRRTQVLHEVWDGPPIEAIVSDANSEQVWAFTAFGKHKEKMGRFFFRLDAASADGLGQISQYQLPQINTKDLPATVAQVLPYVNVLQTHKKL